MIETVLDRDGIRNCPFCVKGEGVLVVSEVDGVPVADEDYHVRCQRCFAQGPNRMDERRAIAEWNAVMDLIDKLAMPDGM